MKYSFVLPAYKSRFLREAIDSILNQTYKEFELVIVNDASPEDLDSIVNSYDDNRIRYYVNEKNIGGKDLVAQWNHCLEYATGEYIILASDDDVYHPKYLEKMNVLVEKYPNVNVFRPRIKIIDAKSDTKFLHGYLHEYVGLLEFFYYWMRGHVGSGIGLYLIKKEALIHYGGFVNFPLAWGSDDATILLLSQNGIVFSQNILFSFRLSNENITSKRNDTQSLKNKLYAYKFFFEWLKHFTNELKVRNNEVDIIYLTYIKKNLSSFFESNTMSVLSSSSLRAIVANVKHIMGLKFMTVKDFFLALYHSC